MAQLLTVAALCLALAGVGHTATHNCTSHTLAPDAASCNCSLYCDPVEGRPDNSWSGHRSTTLKNVRACGRAGFSLFPARACVFPFPSPFRSLERGL